MDSIEKYITEEVNFVKIGTILQEENIRLGLIRKISPDLRSIKKSNVWIGIQTKKEEKKDANGIVHGLVGATNVAHITIGDISWYVPDYTPIFPQQKILREQINSRAPTQLSYIEKLLV